MTLYDAGWGRARPPAERGCDLRARRLRTITRDKFSRLHLVAAGRIDRDAAALLESHMLLSAVDALGQSYDYLVVDAGAQSEVAIAPIAQITARAVLVPGEAPDNSVEALREQLLSSGFADVRGACRHAA
jgi:succinoglycan biosynthesis transport protein ExoP